PLSETILRLAPTPTVADSRGSRNATAGRSDDAADFGSGWTLSDAAFAGRFGDYEAAVRRHEALLGGPAPEPTEPGKNGQPRLTAAFPEWMCAFPAGWISEHV